MSNKQRRCVPDYLLGDAASMDEAVLLGFYVSSTLESSKNKYAGNSPLFRWVEIVQRADMPSTYNGQSS